MDLIQLKYNSQLDKFLSNKLVTPRYRPQQTLDISNVLYKKLDGYLESRLSQIDINNMSEILATTLGGCKPGAFVSTLQYFAKYPLSQAFLIFICKQVAASRYALKKNVPFDIFKGAQGFEWLPFKVTDVFQDSERKGYHILGIFTDGRACGITFDLQQKNIGYRFYRTAGLSRKSLKGVNLNSKDIVGFTYMALLQYKSEFPLDFTNKCVKRLDRDAITAVRCTASQAGTNKALYAERLTPCPFKLRTPCGQCFIGYDYCPRGCRTSTNWAATTNPPMEILVNGKRNR